MAVERGDEDADVSRRIVAMQNLLRKNANLNKTDLDMIEIDFNAGYIEYNLFEGESMLDEAYLPQAALRRTIFSGD